MVSQDTLLDACRERSYPGGFSARHGRLKIVHKGQFKNIKGVTPLGGKASRRRYNGWGYTTVCRQLRNGRLGVCLATVRSGKCDYCFQSDFKDNIIIKKNVTSLRTFFLFLLGCFCHFLFVFVSGTVCSLFPRWMGF